MNSAKTLQNPGSLVEILQSLEPTFVEAGKLALRMQKGVDSHQKYSTGNHLVDTVTEADLAVQEFLLEQISKTELVNCRLLAEENTALVNIFNEKGKYYLGIDPIDGTATYANDGKCFSTIISLHDGKSILYMFGHYPALDWRYRVANNNYSASGKTPNFELPPEIKDTIVYWSGNPEETLPREICEEIKSKGIGFKKVLDIGEDVDSITMLALDKVAGTYNEDPNAYDGLAEFSIASARGFKLYSGGPSGRLDLSNIKKRESGFYYPGYYLTLRQ